MCCHTLAKVPPLRLDWLSLFGSVWFSVVHGGPYGSLRDSMMSSTFSVFVAGSWKGRFT